jgi:hypothetical protein
MEIAHECKKLAQIMIKMVMIIVKILNLLMKKKNAELLMVNAQKLISLQKLNAQIINKEKTFILVKKYICLMKKNIVFSQIMSVKNLINIAMITLERMQQYAIQ